MENFQAKHKTVLSRVPASFKREGQPRVTLVSKIDRHCTSELNIGKLKWARLEGKPSFVTDVKGYVKNLRISSLLSLRFYENEPWYASGIIPLNQRKLSPWT